jgi:bla regulator protein blaR1
VETLLHLGLSNALVATVLAVAAAGVSRLVRRPALVHSLWLLVLLKLVTPPLVSVPVIRPIIPASEARAAESKRVPEAARLVLIGPAEAFAAAVDTNVLAESEFAPEQSGPATSVIFIEPAIAERIAPRAPAVETAASAVAVVPTFFSWLPPWPLLFVSAWVAGSLFWLGLAAWRIVRFGWLVRQAHPAPLAVYDRVRWLCERLGIASAPRVGFIPGCVSPLLWALSGPPCLLLPVALWDQLDDDQRDALLVHELAHLRRRDHWIRNLELVATGLYWWHPVVWWARRALREAEEQCCDAWVVWAMPKSARAYATALLQTVEFLSSAPRTGLPMAASGLGHLSSLKRRLIMIMQEPTPRALSWAGRLVVLGLAAVLLPVAPSWAQRAAKDDDPPQQQIGRVESDDDDDEDADAPRLRIRADRKSQSDDNDQDGKDREKQLEDARAQVKKIEAQLAERRAKLEATFAKARRQLEAQMQEAQRGMADAQSELQKAMKRLAELESGNPGRDGQGSSRVEINRRIERRRGSTTPPSPGPGDVVQRIPGQPGQPDVFIFRREERRDGPGGSPPMPPAPPGAPGAPGGGPEGGPPMPPAPPGAPPMPPGGFGGGGARAFRFDSRLNPGDFGGGALGGARAVAPQTERRLDELEKKLDRLLDEVAKLKKSSADSDADGKDDKDKDKENRERRRPSR